MRCLTAQTPNEYQTGVLEAIGMTRKPGDSFVEARENVGMVTQTAPAGQRSPQTCRRRSSPPPTPPRAAPRVLRAHARVARVGGLHLCRESRARLHDGRGLGELVVLVLGDAGVRGKDDVRLAVVHSLEIDAVGVVKEDGQVGAELLVGIRDPEAQAGLPRMESPVSRDWAADRRERPLPTAGTPP